MKPDPDFYRAKHESEGERASWAWRNPSISELARREYNLHRRHLKGASETQLAAEAAKR